ncbi:Aste57867_7787 [Aphanomyces stellatus]|uniref:Aste57867_7787 protein n=1 Tax=Aphanomyces stellatus TaxID=120398 RepID=A0A485KIU2_9STRA|nr:hypothetical protein As57867_007757 [Aphanomyces stellatus]VFT84686.1 Aste57867_7787 [Aphanomyces stellatus]
MCNNAVEFANTLAKVIDDDKTSFISTGDTMYLYLIDEVEGAPIIPSKKFDQVYPIRIDTQSPQFLAVGAPFLQAGLRLLQCINTATNVAKCVGIPNPTGPFLEKSIQILNAAKNKSSVVDFNVVHAAIQSESDDPVPMQRIRGAALRELERFFNEKDPKKTYAGLQRTYTADGNALWTSEENAKKINIQKPRTFVGGQANSVVNYNKELLLTQENSSGENIPGIIQKEKANDEKMCACELM